MRVASIALSIALVSPVAVTAAGPIEVSRANPHYFARDGKPIVLVSSDHHYGAVIDLDFDYAAFLDTLAANRMNLTRIYPGGMFEPPDKYAPGNPLGPLAGATSCRGLARPRRVRIQPWRRPDTHR